ncbi:MAG: hypothetical protein IPK26_22620 [Planctomycetes bacterium]|nr:hypothetical protein [Planctomycetota bacterium]
MKSFRYPVPACAALAILTGCSSPPYAAYAIEDDAELVSHVVVADGSLQDVVRVGQPLVERMPGNNALRVVVPIRNVDDEPIEILAEMSFQTVQKTPLMDDTNRQYKRIAAGHTINFEAISRKQEAADWVLRLSWNK